MICYIDIIVLIVTSLIFLLTIFQLEIMQLLSKKVENLNEIIFQSKKIAKFYSNFQSVKDENITESSLFILHENSIKLYYNLSIKEEDCIINNSINHWNLLTLLSKERKTMDLLPYNYYISYFINFLKIDKYVSYINVIRILIESYQNILNYMIGIFNNLFFNLSQRNTYLDHTILYKHKIENITFIIKGEIYRMIFSDNSLDYNEKYYKYRENSFSKTSKLMEFKCNCIHILHSQETMNHLMKMNSCVILFINLFAIIYLLMFIESHFCNYGLYFRKKYFYLYTLLLCFIIIYIIIVEYSKAEQLIMVYSYLCKSLRRYEKIKELLESVLYLLHTLLKYKLNGLYLLIIILLMIVFRGVFYILGRIFSKEQEVNKEVISNDNELSTNFKITSNTPNNVKKITKNILLSNSNKKFMSNINNLANTVYVTNSGKMYHKDMCQYLKKSTISFPKLLSELVGFKPCSVCKPL